MSFLRTTAFAAALLLTGPALATDVSMADGAINYSVPDNWMGIMQTSGDPEVRVFQVPDPSPTANDTLARVTITVKNVASAADFRQYVNAANTKAQGLPGYKAVRGVSNTNGPDDYVYTAQEGGKAIDYVEHYWYRGGHAIQLRCLRPASSQAGNDWIATFDKGCSTLAATLGR